MMHQSSKLTCVCIKCVLFSDLSQLGAVGFTPPSEGELIPEAEPEEHDHQEIRRRRLQKLSSQTEET